MLFTTDRVWPIVAYALPAAFIAWLISHFAQRVLVVWFMRLPGILAHEICHWAVALFTFAGPTSLSLIPRRIEDGRWQLGAVYFRNLAWYNAALVCLAPLLCLPLAVWIIWWRTGQPGHLGVVDLGYWYLIAQLMLSGWPSRGDLQLAASSLPMLVFVAGAAWYLFGRVE